MVEIYNPNESGVTTINGLDGDVTLAAGTGITLSPVGNTITIAAPQVGTITGSGNANEITYFTGSTAIGSLAVATYPSLTELSYVKGVTSAIQTQLNGKQASGSYATTALDNLASVAMNASLQFNNTSARTFDIAPTANTVAGNALTISAGSTVTGGTADMAGGNLILNSGLGKGTGASSIIFQTGKTLTTGSTLQTLTTAMTILGNGNVGIGTTAPDQMLTVGQTPVAGTATTGGNQDIYSTYGANLVTAGTAWTLTNNGNSAMTASGTTVAINGTGTSQYAQPNPALTIVAGQTYYISFMTSAITGSATYGFGGTANNSKNNLAQNTTYGFYYVAVNTGANLGFYAGSSGTQTWTISNIIIQPMTNGSLTVNNGLTVTGGKTNIYGSNSPNATGNNSANYILNVYNSTYGSNVNNSGMIGFWNTPTSFYGGITTSSVYGSGLQIVDSDSNKIAEFARGGTLLYSPGSGTAYLTPVLTLNPSNYTPSAEFNPNLLVGGSTLTLGAGYANQRFSLFNQSTITAGSALAISGYTATQYIAGAPILAGSATAANSAGLYIDSGTSLTTGVTNGYGLYVNAPTGASSNYAATFMGGNVGIGTTSPGAKLQVNGLNIPGTSIVASDIPTVGRDLSIITTDAQAADVGAMLSLGGMRDDASANPGIFGGIRGGKENATTGNTAGYLGFYTLQPSIAFAERMRITSTGNVGIGTTSPTAYLNIKAGTATANTAPIKLTAGVLTTVAVSGQLETDASNNPYWTNATPTRGRVPFGNSASATLTAGTTTTITDTSATTTSKIILSPTCLAWWALTPYVSTKSAGSFVITTLTALGTETFDYQIIN